jgi:hypothetical protein
MTHLEEFLIIQPVPQTPSEELVAIMEEILISPLRFVLGLIGLCATMIGIILMFAAWGAAQ